MFEVSQILEFLRYGWFAFLEIKERKKKKSVNGQNRLMNSKQKLILTKIIMVILFPIQFVSFLLLSTSWGQKKYISTYNCHWYL